MRLRSFSGASMSEVMRQIKQEMGDEAVIVSSRTQDDGLLRVTAAVEDDITPDPVEPIDLMVDNIADQSALFSGIHDYSHMPAPDAEHKLDTVSRALVRHNVPATLVDRVMVLAEQDPVGTAQDILARVLEQIFRFEPLPLQGAGKPLMLVGQPGAGKTTTIAKLAARAVLNGLSPVVITADTTRAGGVEQLAAFTRVLQLPLYKVSAPDQLKKALADHRDADLVLIDCPGLNAFDPQDMKELHAYIKVAPMDLVITLPGGMDMEESVEIARAFAVLGARWMVPTRLDMSRRLGGILAAAAQADVAFGGAGHKPDIADGFLEMDASMLAAWLLPPAAQENR